MAKLLVPSGAPVHFNDGEVLLPSQPKTLASMALVPTAPFLMSSLVTFICACATGAANTLKATATAPNVILCIVSLPSVFGRRKLA